MGARENCLLIAGIALLAAVCLYAFGWLLPTSVPEATGYSTAQVIEQTEKIRAVTENIRLQGRLLWWGDRLFVAAAVFGLAGAILTRRSGS